LGNAHYFTEENIMAVVSEEYSGVLKIEPQAECEDQELDFEINYQRTLTTQQRFELMFRKSREIMEVMLRHGHRKPVEIVKRT
jgi:hypothetical protein